jgi:hypothetical protein
MEESKQYLGEKMDRILSFLDDEKRIKLAQEEEKKA